jgi:hypothetical protein
MIPLQGIEFDALHVPGRCPGLIYYSPLGNPNFVVIHYPGRCPGLLYFSPSENYGKINSIFDLLFLAAAQRFIFLLTTDDTD